MQLTRWYLTWCAPIAFTVSACGGGGDNSTGPRSGGGAAAVQVSGATEVLVNGLVQLTALARDASGSTIAGTINWTSGSPSIAVVNSTGLVAGVARGTVTITATEAGSGISGTLELPVRIGSATLSLSSANLSSLGDSATASASGLDADGVAVSGVTFSFTSSDPGVATVNSSGIVVAVDNGNAVITATADGRSAMSSVIVQQVAVGAGVTPRAPTIRMSDMLQLMGGAVDARGNVIAGTGMWSSTNTAIVTVDPTGRVTGLAVGSANVIVTAAGAADTSALTVTDPTLQGQVQPILSANCALSGCHAGASPQQGQNLEAGQTFSNVVNVQANEAAALFRVRPFFPDSSYLVHKIQGTQASVGGSGGRMPLGGPFLSQFQIDVIRQWITAGAQNN